MRPISIKNPGLIVSLLFLSILLFSSTSLSYWLFEYSWLEQQRITQIALITIGSALWLITRPHQKISAPWPLLTALTLGLVSSLLSTYPDWALKEWAKYTTMLALLVYFGEFFTCESRQKIITALLVAVSLVLTIQFMAFYLASFFSGTQTVDPYLMYPGFDNPRFYGQFQIILIPILHALYFKENWQHPIFSTKLITAILIFQWAIIWALAGRGVLLGLFAAVAALIMLTQLKHRKIIVHLGLTALLGAFLYFILFHILPDWAGLKQSLPSGMRFDLSRRDVLWGGAWQMIISQPWLGVGPLHFSASWNHIGAHPHQAVLQFASEWGIPATLLFLWVIALSMLKGLRIIRIQQDPLDVGLWLALLASLVLAQVDGVFAMPYTEGWLTIIAGLALARWKQTNTIKTKPVHQAQTIIFSLLTIVSIIVLMRVLILDVPALHESHKKFIEKHKIGSPPRFWDQGWIPMEREESNH